MGGLSKKGWSLDHEHITQLVPRKQYRPKLKKAMDALPELDPDCIDLVPYLFSKEEQEWLRDQYAMSRSTQGKHQDTPPSTSKVS